MTGQASLGSTTSPTSPLHTSLVNLKSDHTTTHLGASVPTQPNRPHCCCHYSCTTSTTPTWWGRRNRNLRNTFAAATSMPDASPTWLPPPAGQPLLYRHAREQVSQGVKEGLRVHDDKWSKELTLGYGLLSQGAIQGVVAHHDK